MKSWFFKLVIIVLVIASPFSLLEAGVRSVIVEFDSDPAAIQVAQSRQNGIELSEQEIEDLRAQIRVQQESVLNNLANQAIAFQIGSATVADYDGNSTEIQLRYTLVYNGINLLVEDSALSAIAAAAGVKAVHDDSVFQPALDKSVRYIRANEVYGGVAELTQFDDLREGYEGQGIHLSIIDTGIEWQHEMFGGDPAPPRLGIEPATALVGRNQKITYYLPLADAAVEDAYGHGTHVASTAAGYLGFAPGADGLPLTEDDIPLHGVAPQAKLMSYAVCSDALSTVGSLTGAVGGCLTSAIVMGIEDSVSPRTVNGFAKPVAHVINMSLGGAGTPDSPTAVASDNASRLGTIVVSSAGNSGPGQATVGAPAAGRHVIAVGASTDPGGGEAWSSDILDAAAFDPTTTGAVVPAAGFSSAAGEMSNIKLFPMAGTPVPPEGSMAQFYVYVENGEIAVNWPATVQGRIALIRSGGLPATFAQIVNNAAANGAVAALFISSTENPTAARGVIPGANIAPADADYLLGLISGVPGVNPPNGAISNHPLRINPRFGTTFEGAMAGFSSRGPVAGFGQVKPDVAAPGVNVLAAMPPASLLGALSGGNYGAISGTSMASPHVAGAAALVKQAHPGWDPATVRTVLMNTSTNLRDADGVAKSDGTQIESIIDQGAGLIDVYEAVNAKAMMGVAGDGIILPSILGSHSFGAVPVVNSRVSHTETVTVQIQDLSGEGGSYDLTVANNRELERAGVSVSLSAATVSVPAGGAASLGVDVTVDGNLVRQGPVQIQFYLEANRTDGAETLRMPLFMQAIDSIPAASGAATEVYEGTVIVGDSNLFLLGGVSHVDFDFEVGTETVRVDASLEWAELVDDTVADLDFYLLDTEGNEIASSTNPGGPEFISLSLAPGPYVYRASGWVSGPTDFTLTSVQIVGGGSPTMNAFTGDFVDSSGKVIDFDGDFTVNWQPNGDESFFEIEHSTDNSNWSLVATLDGGTTSLAVQDQPVGVHYYRVRALVPAVIGYYATDASESESIVVDHRVRKRITQKVSTAITSASFINGVFSIDLALTNDDSKEYVPLVELNVIKIDSASGTVEAINADNGGNGRKKSTRALYDYSYQLGADDTFSAGETTGVRTLQFADPAAELFTFKVCITGYQQVGDGSGSTGGETPEGGGGSAAPESDDSILDELTAVLQFTVNPLTQTVVVELIDLP